MLRRHSPHAPRQAHREQRHGEAEQPSPALEAHEEAHPRHAQPRRARLEGRGPRVVAVERRDREATERHGEPRHRADVAQHRPRLDEVERHRRQGDGRVDAGPPVEEARDERVRREHAEQTPEGERQPPGPLVQAEELEAQGDRRERELRAAEIVQVREASCRPRRGRGGSRGRGCKRDASRQVGDVQLVGVPQAVARERGDGEEEQRRDGRGHRQRNPAPIGPTLGRGSPGERRGALREAPLDSSRRRTWERRLVYGGERARGHYFQGNAQRNRRMLELQLPRVRLSRSDPRRERGPGRPSERRQEHAAQRPPGRADRHHEPPPADHARGRARRPHDGGHAVRRSSTRPACTCPARGWASG